MKVSTLFVVGLCVLLTPVVALANWSDNFDSYATGSGLHGQGGWHGWDGDPAWDAYLTDLYFISAPNSVEIAASSDIVHNFDEISGKWFFTAWQYIPTGFNGQSYLLLLNTYNDGGPYNWSSQVMFNSSTGQVVSDPEGDTLPLIMGQWVEIRVEIDLAMDLQTFYYNGQPLYQKSWTEGVSGGGVPAIGAVDLYANNASPVYYDDLSLILDEPVASQQTTWGAVRGLFR